MSSLSQQAFDVIEHYKNLHIGGKKIRTPYFNNKRNRIRAALRVNIGKGAPKDIEDEVTILAAREKEDLSHATVEQIVSFLVDHNLGVDCSGFVFHVLNAQHHGRLGKMLSFPKGKNPFRKAISRFRPVENTSVKVLADEKNTESLDMQDMQAGDVIIMLATGSNHDLDHVLLVTEVSEDKIRYTHSLRWNADGQYNHGIKDGVIELIKPQGTLLDQHWIEAGEDGEKNETLWRAQTAEVLEIRRLKDYKI